MDEERGWVRWLTGPWVGLGLLLIGLALGTWWPDPVSPIQTGVGYGISAIIAAGPYIILFSILPSLTNLLDTGGGKAPAVVLGLFVLSSAAAGIFALIVSGLVFQLPLGGGGNAGMGETLDSVATLISSPSGPILGVFWAFGSAFVLHAMIVLDRFVGEDSLLSPVTGGLGYFARATRDVFQRIFDIAVDGFGHVLEYTLPILLFSIGTYVPLSVQDAASEAGNASSGFSALPWYLGTSALIAAVTLAYLILMATIALRLTGRSWSLAFREYVVPVYAFAWSTVSSTATIPINVDAAGKGLNAREETRGFVIPLGATVNLDGTLIASLLITPVVAMAVGIELTFPQLAATLIPLFLMTVGAPGLPAGMSFLAPPVIAAVLGLTGGVAEAFIGVWFAFSLGLADQFRTGVNSVNNGFITLIAERILYGAQPHLVLEEVEGEAPSALGG